MLPGTVGLIQATEAIKLVLGKGDSLVGRLMLFDSLKMTFRDVKIQKDPDCELCGEHPTVTELIDYEAFCDIPMPSYEKEDIDEAAFSMDVQELEEILKSGKEVVLVDVRDPNEWDICHIDGAKLMPVGEFDKYIPELNPEDEILLYCYKGVRSMNALKKLHAEGFTKLKSVTGGIDRWAEIVDTSMPRY
ncbi:MAG: hypothetical protein HQM13_15685 [SAR324 cluster bacterium]|nr:hypothetical protein [SAR324 cluster bacterium]